MRERERANTWVNGLAFNGPVWEDGLDLSAWAFLKSLHAL